MNATAFDRSATSARQGYDPTPAHTIARVRPMLDGERVVWLSTVRPDGTPHLVPTWFWWDGEALLVFSKPGAAKVRNLRANPKVMIALGDPEDDFSVGLIEAVAECVDDAAPVPDAFFAKYAAELGPGRLDPVTFRALYTQAIRIVPTRYLAWHGRGDTHDAAAPSMAARRPSLVSRLASAVARLVAPAPLAAGAA
jgi:PPOX class probable F420-dependent enzyme